MIVLLTRLSTDATTARRRSAALRTARIVGHVGWRCHDRQTGRIGQDAKVIVSVAPSEGAIMAAPEGTRAPLVDGSGGGTQPLTVMRTDQPRSQGERKPKARGDDSLLR